MSTLIPPKHALLKIAGPAQFFGGCDCFSGCEAELPYTVDDQWVGSDPGGKFMAKLTRAVNCKASLSFLSSPGCPGIADVPIGSCVGAVSTGFFGDRDCCGGDTGPVPSYGLLFTGTVPAVTPPCSCEVCSLEPEYSLFPVRYASGELKLHATDLQSTGFGLSWGHTRSFANRLGLNHNAGNGINWIVNQLPYLQEATFEGSAYVVLMGNPSGGRWFLEQPSDVYVAMFGNKELLTLDRVANVYRRQNPDGSITEFHALTGEFLRQQTPGKHTLELVARTSDKTRPAIIEQTATANGVTTVEQFLYEYGAPANILLSRVTLRRRQYTGSSSSSGDDWTNVARATYTYYGSADTYGAAGDLRTATTFVWQDADWVATGTSYYRYWTATSSSSSSSSSSGGGGSSEAPHLLKYVLNPAAFDRLSADPNVSDPYLATNTQVALYADYYFEYDDLRRVTKEVVKGGSQTFLFAYALSLFGNNYNHWKTRTIETLPDGNQNIVYLNHAGQTMLKVFQSGDNQWLEFWRYDVNARVVLHAHPSAVSGYDDTYADLLNYNSLTGTYEFLRDDEGLLEMYTIHSASGLVASEAVRQGQLGTSIQRREFGYCCCGSDCGCGGTSSSSSSSSGSGCASGVWLLKTETVYPSDTNQSLKLVTSHCYSFHSGTCAVKEHVITLPVVGTGQNGNGVAATRREYFDSYGNLTWSMDERGYIARSSYDTPTGAITQQVADVDTSLYPDEPAGWSTPSGGGLNLVTDFEHDNQGRITQTLGPSHSVDLGGTATTVRTASWTVYDDVNHVTYSGQGEATGTSPSYSYTLIDPVSIIKMDAGGRVNEQIQATAPSTSGTLADIIEDAGGGEDAFPQSSYTSWTTMQYTDCCLAASQRVYHTIPASGEGTSGTNYDETDFGYEVMKRRNRTVTPGGTITDLVYDARGMVVATYVGTNDDGATVDDPTGGGLDPDNNMVLVHENEYDDGLDGGDVNLTEMTQHVDDTTTRVTSMTYDFRNRRVTADGEIDYFEKSYYDNLDRVVKSERYNTTSGGNLIGRNETKFDDRGRVYQSIRYAVDPSTGSVGNTLTDNTWFDAAGNVIKSLPSGSDLFTKTEYDSLNRPQTRYTGYDLDETGYPG